MTPIVTDEWTVEKAIPEDLKELLRELESEHDTTFNLQVFLHILGRLKTTKRTGWLLYGVNDSESISDHMYRMGTLAFFCPPQLDSSKCMKIALVHDMAEAIVGDITPFDGIDKQEKHRRELTTIQYLRDLIAPFNKDAAQEIYELWHEYENITSPEARFVKDVDKYEFMVQCVEEERRFNRKIDMGQCIGVRRYIKTPQVGRWADDLIARRLKYWDGHDEAEVSTNNHPAARLPSDS